MFNGDNCMIQVGKLLVVFASLVILAGCATAPRVDSKKVYQLQQASQSQSDIAIVDNRPGDEKHFQIKGNGGYYALGDENFQPDRMSVLKNQLSNLLDGKKLNTPIVVESFKILIIDFTGAVGTSNFASGLGYTSGISNLFYPEDLMASCTIAIRIGNEKFEKKEFQTYPAAKFDEGLKDTVTKTIRMVAEQIKTVNMPQQGSGI